MDKKIKKSKTFKKNLFSTPLLTEDKTIIDTIGRMREDSSINDNLKEKIAPHPPRSPSL